VESGYTATSFTPRRLLGSVVTLSNADKHARFPENLVPFGLVLAAVMSV
jgi:hypothetical protein